MHHFHILRHIFHILISSSFQKSTKVLLTRSLFGFKSIVLLYKDDHQPELKGETTVNILLIVIAKEKGKTQV